MYVGDLTFRRKEEGPNKCRLSRKHIFDSVKQSLERLQLNYIDVLQCHKFDYDTPISETVYLISIQPFV